MRSIKYLNSVLTVIALLLTLTLWTLWQTPAGQTLTVAEPAAAQGTLSQLELQRQMRDLMKANNAELKKIAAGMAKLEKGPVKVNVIGD